MVEKGWRRRLLRVRSIVCPFFLLLASLITDHTPGLFLLFYRHRPFLETSSFLRYFRAPSPFDRLRPVLRQELVRVVGIDEAVEEHESHTALLLLHECVYRHRPDLIGRSVNAQHLVHGRARQVAPHSVGLTTRVQP